MIRLAISFLLILMMASTTAVAQGTFGPRENKLIYDGSKGYIQYRIDNTDNKTPWLVQAWVEDYKENKIKDFTPTPFVFRVEPSSVFSVRVMKTGTTDEFKETLFWLVSNTIPGGAKSKQQNEDDKITAKLSLAYRFKVPMIYRPTSLKNIQQKPESLEWSLDEKGKLKVKNPSRYVVQLHSVTINGTIHQGSGVSYFILPMSGVEFNFNAKSGSRVDYAVINDYGALNKYEGVIK
ncbi:TPA: molecular chaperone [Escherichia coli]|uniref:CS30 fimbrial chaperone I n=2 Tax=Escherichia coli TaxID=562 RepID=A0A161KC25_ECOLX|nr:molecular chaperone [Escherichia coli]MBK2485318.1 molecular chaperone [Klebsiella pneumoniae]EES9566312.1 molecular chaperone [Escherichia coli]EEV9791356.1 molecular chaperone [Escherichia coli]EEW1328337.1 molecular chaperone [Escherichia coli]EEY7371163.1 molecular chaperone [Escherichia coli]